MRLLVISDIDDLSWKFGQGHADILLSCGDIFDQVIIEAAQAYHCSRILAVKGNHDPDTSFPLPIMDMHIQTVGYNGFRFGGLNGSWRYKSRGQFLYSQDEVESMLAGFPSVDIFLSHNSPSGTHNRDDGIHYGFDALNAYIERTKPKLVIHGHQHVNSESRIEDTRIIGVYGYRLIEL